MAKKKITKTITKSAASKPAKPAKVNAVTSAAKAKEVKKNKTAQPAVTSRAPKADTPGKTAGMENAKQRGSELQVQAACGHFEVVKSAISALRRRLRTQSTAASRKSSGAAVHGAGLDAALARLVEDYKRVLGMRDA